MKKVFSPSFVLLLWAGFLATFPLTSFAQELDRIKPEELKTLIEAKADVLVVDNQPKGAYDAGHIPGSVNFPWAPQIKPPVNLPRNKTLVLYCACSHEEDAAAVGEQLVTQYGYTKVKLLDGGWLKWVELGYPVENK
jgi:rhodanese-related sulfurtransferase